MKDELEIAYKIGCAMLKAGVVLQAYTSVSTSSIYFKLDYGVAHSIRIADHSGKKHLNYCFNIIKDATIHKKQGFNGYLRYFYGWGDKDVQHAISDILQKRQQKIMANSQTMYEFYMKQNEMTYHNDMGFWRNSVLISSTEQLQKYLGI